MHLCIGAASRDPKRWDNPDECDIDRPPKASLAFGGGPHICLGMHVARAEMSTGINALLDRLPGLRLDPDAEARSWSASTSAARRRSRWPSMQSLQSPPEPPDMTVQDVSVNVVVSQNQRLAQLAEERPDEIGYRHVRLDGSEVGVSYGWLHRRSLELAAALAEKGVGHGDRVGLGLRNSPQFAIAAFATWKLGAVPVPVRWDVPDWELDPAARGDRPQGLSEPRRPAVDRRHRRPSTCPTCPT